MFFWYIPFWSSFRVTLDLGEAHARRSKFESVFPGGRNPEGGAPGRRNLGRNSPEGRIRVRVFKNIETTQKRRFSVEIWQQLEVAPDPHVGLGRVIYKSIQNSEPDTLSKFEKKLQKHFSTSCRGSRRLRQISN